MRVGCCAVLCVGVAMRVGCCAVLCCCGVCWCCYACGVLCCAVLCCCGVCWCCYACGVGIDTIPHDTTRHDTLRYSPFCVFLVEQRRERTTKNSPLRGVSLLDAAAVGNNVSTQQRTHANVRTQMYTHTHTHSHTQTYIHTQPHTVAGSWQQRETHSNDANEHQHIPSPFR